VQGRKLLTAVLNCGPKISDGSSGDHERSKAALGRRFPGADPGLPGRSADAGPPDRLAVTEDREAQERVFGPLQAWQRNPDTIRRLLTHVLIPATDRKAIFVGVDAYTAAGGTVQRDLFSEDRGGWIADPALLERLVAERMEAAAEAIRSEGWRWVAIGQDAQAGAWNLRRVWPSKVVLSPEDEARRDANAGGRTWITPEGSGCHRAAGSGRDISRGLS
jgi:hypothetical protein